MSHIRSKRLYEYLEKSGSLSQGPEAVALAKREYRRQYKREYKRQDKQRIEMRPGFKITEYEGICLRAKLYGFKTPTAYIQNLILSHQEEKVLIPKREILLRVLQSLSMAVISSMENNCDINISDLLSKAEADLLHYLHEA